ncbi:MAG: Nif3-like dinuclear metal center hexameric protein [Clostridia bacterium]
MTLNEFIASMYSIAPLELAMSYDNVGLIIGTDRSEIKNVLVALDCTTEVAREAVRTGADLVLTHHPLFFNGIKRILPNHPDTSAAYILVRNGIGLYSAHTNLDAAKDGVNDVLCSLLEIENAVPVPPENIARVGNLRTEVPLSMLLKRVNRELYTLSRYTGELTKPIKRVAVMGGSGGGDIQSISALGADAFITGEIKHSQAISALALDLPVIVAGHHETEFAVLKPLIKRLQKLTLGVKYNLAVSGATPLKLSPES